MKFLIMGFTKIKFMPYMNFYLENIDKQTNEVHVLYWNRDLKNEDVSSCGNVLFHEFRCYQEDDVPKIRKVKSFVQYRKYAKKIIDQEKFDFIIVLHSLTGVIIQDILKKKYRNKYIFDYRDSTYERFSFFKKNIGILTINSYATFVSSDAFRSFLPEEEKEKIFTSHNLLTDSLSHRNEKELYGIPSNRIRIAFWGFIRHEEINREIIKKVSMDSRFELHYYGREQQVALNLKKYAKELASDNVFFHGEYNPEDRYKFVRQTDIIHNIYFDSNMMLAMGNKYYDGIIFKIPQICMQGSFMGERVTNNCIGYQCDPYSDDFLEKVLQYYKNIELNSFETMCEKELYKVLDEYDKGRDLIKNIKF